MTSPSALTNSILTVVASGTVTDCSFEKKSSWPIVVTAVFESADQAPIECGIILRVFLDRLGGTPIGVAFAEDRINRAALDLVITRLDFLFLVVLGLIRIVGELVSLALQLRDGRLQLRDRCADIRQFDDVRFRCGRQIAELGERIADLLIGGEILWEIRP